MNAILMATLLAASASFGQSNVLLGAAHDNSLHTVATYAELWTLAEREDRPLVLAIGCAPKAPLDFLLYVEPNVNRWPGEKRGVHLLIPRDGKLVRAGHLPPGATSVEIFDLASRVRGNWIREGVSRTAVPFGGRWFRWFREADRVDADVPATSSWPDGVPFPPGAIRYDPAQFTQEIATTNGAPRIAPVPRRFLRPSDHLPTSWQAGVPGGMEGVHGYRSTLYKLVPDGGWTGTMRLPVKNPFGFYQNELGWTREYPDGTLFVDVLDNQQTGKVFEARAREKSGGDWHSYVFFRRRDHYPAGYAGLRGRQCMSCHQEAGTGDYGIGLVPGGDTVISDPFPALEQR